MNILENLKLPILIAPMAGGPSTPSLVNAAAEAGTLGFLAGGTMGIDDFKADLGALRTPFGVNLFRPQTEKPKPSDIDEVAGLLTQAFREYGLGEPRVPAPDFSNCWAEKFDAAIAANPAVISCTFGIFDSSEFARLHEAGIAAWVTVSNPEDALTAERAGADALVVQGPEAGGHRSTWTIDEEPDARSLVELFNAVKKAGVRIPLIAAGGITSSEVVAQMLDLGAVAVSCGSAFLLADEAGTSAQNREILQSIKGTETRSVSSRAFSGRYARGVETNFSRDNDRLPPLYPYLNPMITPLRKASGSAGNWDYAYCLVGTGVSTINEGSVNRILKSLNPSG